MFFLDVEFFLGIDGFDFGRTSFLWVIVPVKARWATSKRWRFYAQIVIIVQLIAAAHLLAQTSSETPSQVPAPVPRLLAGERATSPTPAATDGHAPLQLSFPRTRRSLVTSRSPMQPTVVIELGSPVSDPSTRQAARDALANSAGAPFVQLQSPVVRLAPVPPEITLGPPQDATVPERKLVDNPAGSRLTQSSARGLPAFPIRQSSNEIEVEWTARSNEFADHALADHDLPTTDWQRNDGSTWQPANDDVSSVSASPTAAVRQVPSRSPSERKVVGQLSAHTVGELPLEQVEPIEVSPSLMQDATNSATEELRQRVTDSASGARGNAKSRSQRDLWADSQSTNELETEELAHRPPPVADRQMTIDEVNTKVANSAVLGDRALVPLGLADVVAQALMHSKAIQVSRIAPAEELQVVNQEFGQFDWRGFVNSTLSQDNQPVGDLNQTNLAINQVRNDQNFVEFGVRKSTQTGGLIELRETLGTRDSNSGLLNPVDQGNARISVTFAQQLLRDGGRDVVLSKALIASLLAEQTHAEAFTDISIRLRDVLVQYWDLYQKRGDFFIQQSLVMWAQETLQILEMRGPIDAQRNSIEQARALLLEARANLENARAAVLISQDTLYRLVNSPNIDSSHFEILPLEAPRLDYQHFDLRLELPEALRSRAEIAQKLSEIQAAAISHHVSLNQLLPRLTLSLESSLNNLDENRDFWGAKAGLTDIDPAYQASLNLEFFFANRRARAQNKQAQLALRRLQMEYEDQIQQVRLDVATAIRTLNASTEILKQRRDTLNARQEEIDYLLLRRDVIPQKGASTSLLLEQLFQAISRLVISQQAYMAAVRDQQAAFADLFQAKGVLLDASQVPRDQAIAVPSLRRAGSEQWKSKPAVRSEALDRVVTPARNSRIPTWR